MEDIDAWFEANGTRHHYPYLAEVSLDWGCEKDSIQLNAQEDLSVLLNGTFFDPTSNQETEYMPPQTPYEIPLQMF